MMRRRRLGAVALVVLALALGGCGSAASGSSSSTLESVERELAAAERGHIDMQVISRAVETEPVGFRVVGVFSFEESGRYPLLDLTYVRTPSDAGPVRIISTGDAVFAGSEGAMGKLDDAQARALKLGEGSAVGQFAFSRWMVEPSVGDDPESGARVTSGSVDVGAFMTDLARLAAQVEGADAIPEPDPDASQRLEQVVESSSMEVISNPESDQLRSLHVVVNLSANASERLREVLGPYAGVSLELLLRYEPLSEPLTVASPS